MTDEEKASRSFKFDFKFFRRFYLLLKILFPSTFSLTTLLFIALLTIALLEQFLAYHVGIIASGFYKVLGDKELHAFWKQVAMSVGVITAMAIVRSTRQFISSVLYLAWRQILCFALHRLYFSNTNFYRINVLDNHIDNPDQRITQDVDKMCSGFSQIFPKLIVFPFVITYYTYQAYISTGYIGPVGTFGFFLLSTVINKILMSSIVGLVVQQEEKEGDFRFKHMQIRSNAESLAFCGSGTSELIRVNNKLGSLLQVQQRIVNYQYGLNCAVGLFDYLGSIVSYLLLAVPIFKGTYDHLSAADLGALISKNAFVCIYLISSFSSLVDLSVQVTDIAGNTHRISELVEYLVQVNKLEAEKVNEPHSQVDNFVQSDNYNASSSSSSNYIGFKLENVSFYVPGQAINFLVKNLTVNFYQGKNILITGESSSGKTSIIRVLRDLWPIFAGKIERKFPSGCKGVVFMSSKPFLTDGSLRQQIIYPLRENDADWDSVTEEDLQLRELLQIVNLSSLEERTGGLDRCVNWNWYDKLSPGEMQRLCFARLFYHQPLIAVLDEATSAISLDIEDKLYRECLKRNISLISIGHRQSLHRYHHSLLKLDGSGGWTQTDIIG